MRQLSAAAAAVVVLGAGAAAAQQATHPAPSTQPAPSCSSCAEWNQSQAPFKIYGNTYYVGPRGLASILITSADGHILIDGALRESVPKIAESIRTLGFRVEDVKLILSTHEHFDHAGGVGPLQRLTGARVAASAPAAEVFRSGAARRDDPQYGELLPIAPAKDVEVIADGQTLRVGTLAITAHLTPGHSPGGTTWTWTSCERDRCRPIVYADSLSAVSADGYLFTDTRANPGALAKFDKAFATVAALPCDILLTPHPTASDLWGRMERGAGEGGLVDPGACRRLVDGARAALAKRVADERGKSRAKQ